MKTIIYAVQRAFGAIIGFTLAKALIKWIRDKALNEKAKQYIKED